MVEEPKVEIWIVFQEDRILVKELRDPVLGDGDPKITTIEELNPDQFPDLLSVDITGYELEIDEESGEFGAFKIKSSRVERDGESSNASGSTEFWNKVESNTGIRYDGENVIFPEEQTGKETIVQFMTFLYEERYLTADDLPIKSGHKRYVLNHEPVNQEGEEMSSPVEIGPDIYLESHRSNDSKKATVKQFGNRFGRR